MSQRIAILGSGMAGMGASHIFDQEGVEPVIFEKRTNPGGHTASYQVGDGFTIDEGPHVSFTKNKRIQELFADNVDQQYEIIQTYVNNYWKGHWIKHPAICNLHGLPTDLNVKILQDFVAVSSQSDQTSDANNFAEWLIACYGETYARTFPFDYNWKYHTTEVENLSTDWLGPRLYRASMDEVFRGALSPETEDVHYIDHFRYPTYGGFEAYLHKFEKRADIRLSHEVTRIDTVNRQLHFANGKTVDYDGLISSIALPDLIPMIPNAPDEVREAAAQLACSTCVCVTVGVDRPDVTRAHWSYFYDRDIIFARPSAPNLLSPHTCPPGMASIQCEVYFSKKYKPLTEPLEQITDRVLADLKRTGLLREDDTLLFTDTRCFPHANVIFDHDRAHCLPIVHGFLQEQDLRYCGRYGDWGYMWTDESFISGERAAQEVLAAL